MRSRPVTLLLTVLVAVGGVALASCPPGRCAAMQAPAAAQHAGMQQHEAHAGMQHAMHQPAAAAHDCCDRDGITLPHCCPDTEQLSQQQAAPSERASKGFQLAATQPVPTALAARATATTHPPRRVPLGAPPGTLIAQHTSLLV